VIPRRWVLRIRRFRYRLRCRLPFLRNRPTRIVGGPLKGFHWLPLSGDFECREGTWEPETQELFLKLIPKGAVVYDLGAHRGFFSLLAAKVAGKEGKVVAFEPLERHVRDIMAHSALNGVTNIIPYRFAISDRNGAVAFTELEDHYANTCVPQSPMFNSQSAILRVEARTLDGLIDEGVPPPHFIKMDIEGAEHDALVGARNTLLRHRPILYFSTHENHLKGVEKKCLDLLATLHYSVSLVKINEVNPENRDYLAVPAERSSCRSTEA
jgi:FkbM family methyltransferase